MKGSLEDILDVAKAALTDHCEPHGPLLIGKENPYGAVTVEEWGYEGDDPSQRRRLFSRPSRIRVTVTGVPKSAESVNVSVYAPTQEVASDVYRFIKGRAELMGDPVFYEDD